MPPPAEGAKCHPCARNKMSPLCQEGHSPIMRSFGSAGEPPAAKSPTLIGRELPLDRPLRFSRQPGGTTSRHDGYLQLAAIIFDLAREILSRLTFDSAAD